VSGETILVIDDGKDNRDFVVEHILKPNGFKPLLAQDGLEGIELAVKHRPDLILLDLQMPRMNGMQVIEYLNSYNLDIPIILMTFHGSEEIAIEVYRMGVTDYLKKPYYLQEMLDAIERSLANVRLRREKEALTERILRANHELKRRIQELNILYNVGKNVTSTVDLEQLLPHIVEAATQITGAEEGLLCLLEGERIMCRAHKNQTMSQARAVNFEVRDQISQHVVKHKQPLTLGPEQLQPQKTKGRKDKNGQAAQPTAASYVPLMLKERVLGVLGVANFTATASEFTASDSALLSALGDYAAIAIENSRNFAMLSKSKEQMRDTFERFVPPSVVQQVLSKPEGVSLGGQRQEISVLFADIRGYTAWSEGAEPEQVIETLNAYLSLAGGVVLGWEGTLDKYFGDGLMAIFNAPEPQPDHVHRAVDTALAILRASEEIQNQYGYNLTYSVGVNVGEAVVGYIGTQRAMNYTALGDTINLAKRLQEYAAPGQILINEAVVQRLGNLVQARPLGEIRVKGRKTPALAYELLDLKSQ